MIGYSRSQSSYRRTIWSDVRSASPDFLKTYVPLARPQLARCDVQGDEHVLTRLSCRPSPTASRTTSTASRFDFRFGAKPPSSPTPVDWPRAFRMPRSAWKISAPVRSASPNDEAPTGITMNSWKSTLESAWAPPLRMFIIGTGSVKRVVPVQRPDVPVERAAPLDAASARARRHRHAEQRVRAETALGRRAIERTHRVVERRAGRSGGRRRPARFRR